MLWGFQWLEPFLTNFKYREKHRQTTCETLYTVTKDEEILDWFLHIDGTAEVNLIPTVPKRKKKNIPNNYHIKNEKDIKIYFTSTAQTIKKSKKNTKNVTTID